jgi:GINS complex subunit 3
MLNVANPQELLAEETLIPSTFKYGAVSIAKGLDPGSTKSDILKEGRMGIPLWLLTDLHRRKLATFDLPEVYKNRYRRKMNAGAECLSLRNRAPFFYEVGIKCNAMLQDIELMAHLSKTFKVRYQELISKGLNTMTGEEVLELICKLSTEEQQLFDGGRASIIATEKWLINDISSSFSNWKKRQGHEVKESNKHPKL